MKEEDQEKIESILNKAKELAVEYYDLTGKPLGITGELGELLAAKHLGLDPAGARQEGYDAKDKDGLLIQIKSRSIKKKSKGGVLSKISLEHEWHKIMFVQMDGEYNLQAIYEANRDSVEEALKKPGSKARNERGQLSVSQFKSIGEKIWQKAE